MGRFSADVNLHGILAFCGFINQHIPILQGISGEPEHHHGKQSANNNYQTVQDVLQTGQEATRKYEVSNVLMPFTPLT